MHVSAQSMASKLTTKMLTLMVCIFTVLDGVFSQYNVHPQEKNYNAHQTKYAPEYNNYKPKNYQFEYGVSDPHTGDHKTQWERKENGVVYGMYSLLEPDGMTRVVEYTADRENGFRAVVKKFPANNYQRADSRLPQSYSYNDVYYKKEDKQNSPIIHSVNTNDNAKLQMEDESTTNSLDENDETDKEKLEVLPINKETENVYPHENETENEEEEEEGNTDNHHEEERNEEGEDDGQPHNLEKNEEEEDERTVHSLPYNSDRSYDYEDE